MKVTNYTRNHSSREQEKRICLFSYLRVDVCAPKMHLPVYLVHQQATFVADSSVLRGTTNLHRQQSDETTTLSTALNRVDNCDGSCNPKSFQGTNPTRPVNVRHSSLQAMTTWDGTQQCVVPSTLQSTPSGYRTALLLLE